MKTQLNEIDIDGTRRIYSSVFIFFRPKLKLLQVIKVKKVERFKNIYIKKYRLDLCLFQWQEEQWLFPFLTAVVGMTKTMKSY